LLKIFKNEASLLILGRLLQLVYSFISIKLLTTLLSIEDVANYYLILSLIGFFSMGLLSPSGSYHLTKFNSLHKSNKLFSSFVVLSLIILSLLLLASPIVYLYFNGLENKTLNFSFILAIMFIELIFGTIAGSVISAFNMFFYRIRFIVYTNIMLFLGLGMALVLIFGLSNSVYFWLLGVTGAKLIVCCWVLFDFKRVFKCHIDWLYVRNCFLSKKTTCLALKFCLPLSISAFAVWSQSHYYRFYVNEYFDLQLVALVSIGFAIATNLTMAFESVINQYFMPTLYKDIDNESLNKGEIYSSIFNAVIPLYLSFFIFLAYFSPLALKLLTNERYSAAAEYMLWGVAIESFRVSLRLFSNVLYLESKTKTIMFSSIIASALLLLLLFYTLDFVLIDITLLPFYILIVTFISFMLVIYKVNKIIVLKLDFAKFFTIIILSSVVWVFSFVEQSNIVFDVIELVVAGILFVSIQFYFNKSLFIKLPK